MMTNREIETCKEKGNREDSLSFVLETLREKDRYDHAARILNYDEETICPAQGMREQGQIQAFLQNQGYRLVKSPAFLEAQDVVLAGREQFDGLARVLVDRLATEERKTRNIPPEKALEFEAARQNAYVSWLEAKEQADFGLFRESLEGVRKAQMEEVSLRPDDGKSLYDRMVDDYEEGFTTEDLDETFTEFLDRMLPVLRKIQASRKCIRTDFLSRTVTDEQQAKLVEYLLQELGFDRSRGAWALTEHPFTDNLGKDDARITTHFFPQAFLSSMYSVIHECGHALFMQLQPAADYEFCLNDRQTMGQHESVSQFYEYRVGKSKAFLDRIYPACREIFPQVLSDVSEREFYEAVNLVQPSLIRTEADEFTFTFHIIIRYELEKAMVNGNLSLAELPERWNALYEKYLGVRPPNDREGVLQDVHWTDGFGYFPAYALGNMYQAMYYNRMKQEMDPEALLRAGDFRTINGWMQKEVFREANHLAPKAWIEQITGRAFTPKDFLDYLEEKYGELYEL